MTIDAIILAAGKIEESLKKYSSASSKAFITIGQKMMVEYSIDAIRQVPTIRRVALVSDPVSVPDLIREKVDLVVKGETSMSGSLMAGINSLSPKPEKVLVMPCDLPMITPAAIEDFLDKSKDPDLDITYAYLSRTDSEAKYPEVHHTYVRLKEGEFCGAGLITMKPEAAVNCKEFLDKLARNRKNPFALASLFGLTFIFKFALKMLTVKEIEDRVRAITGLRVAGIQTRFAEAGFNVDAQRELIIAIKLKEQSNGSEGE